MCNKNPLGRSELDVNLITVNRSLEKGGRRSGFLYKTTHFQLVMKCVFSFSDYASYAYFLIPHLIKTPRKDSSKVFLGLLPSLYLV